MGNNRRISSVSLPTSFFTGVSHDGKGGSSSANPSVGKRVKVANPQQEYSLRSRDDSVTIGNSTLHERRVTSSNTSSTYSSLRKKTDSSDDGDFSGNNDFYDNDSSISSEESFLTVSDESSSISESVGGSTRDHKVGTGDDIKVFFSKENPDELLDTVKGKEEDGTLEKGSTEKFAKKLATLKKIIDAVISSKRFQIGFSLVGFGVCIGVSAVFPVALVATGPLMIIFANGYANDDISQAPPPPTSTQSVQTPPSTSTQSVQTSPSPSTLIESVQTSPSTLIESVQTPPISTPSSQIFSRISGHSALITSSDDKAEITDGETREELERKSKEVDMLIKSMNEKLQNITATESEDTKNDPVHKVAELVFDVTHAFKELLGEANGEKIYTDVDKGRIEKKAEELISEMLADTYSDKASANTVSANTVRDRVFDIEIPIDPPFPYKKYTSHWKGFRDAVIKNAKNYDDDDDGFKVGMGRKLGHTKVMKKSLMKAIKEFKNRVANYPDEEKITIGGLEFDKELCKGLETWCDTFIKDREEKKKE